MEDPLVYVDLFCGAGGFTTAVLDVLEKLGVENVQAVVVNHWDLAIETMTRNHPTVVPMKKDLSDIDPLAAVPGGRVHIMTASPECVYHSKARGNKPMNEQGRATIKYVLRWLKKLQVDVLVVENVREFADWGPLNKELRPVKEKKGQYFREFLRDLQKLGYKFEWRILNSANFGDATTRERFFLIARKDGFPIVWPNATHAKNPEGNMFPLKKWKAAREILDFSIPGKSLYTRKKPLCSNTMRRINHGVQKYWLSGGEIEPFIFASNHGKDDSRAYPVEEPMKTITSVDAWGLAEPFLYIYHGGPRERTRSIDDPIPTVATSNQIGLAEPFLVEYYGTGSDVPINVPLPTQTTKDRFRLVEPILIEKDGKVYLLDIRTRMLTPREMAKAHSFPDWYQFAGRRRDQVKQIGNSVTHNLAAALTGSQIERSLYAI